MSESNLFGEEVESKTAVAPVRKQGPAKLLRASRNQVLLTPTDLEGLLPEDHIVRGMWELVGKLDLSRFLAAIASHTLSDFRVDHKDALDDLMTQVLAALLRHDAVELKRVAQDGTRVRASAGAASFRRKKSLEACLEEARRHVEAVAAEADDGASEVQAAARKRAEQASLSKHVDFRLEDYRDVSGKFDRIVSVGMLEHVGRNHLTTYFAKVAGLLEQDGVALIHSIGRWDGDTGSDGFTERYIFPGGHIPSLSEVIPAIERSGLLVTDIEILRLHYAETLRHWSERFAARRAEACRMYDEQFCRMWEFYLVSAESPRATTPPFGTTQPVASPGRLT